MIPSQENLLATAHDSCAGPVIVTVDFESFWLNDCELSKSFLISFCFVNVTTARMPVTNYISIAYLICFSQVKSPTGVNQWVLLGLAFTC